MTWLPIVILIAIVGVVIVATTLSERRRREALQQLTTEIGLRFDAEPLEELPAELRSLHLFQHGRRRRVGNVLFGQLDGRETWLFDYRYTTGGGKHSHTHKQTVAVYWRDGATLPEFAMRPESIFDKLGALFGAADIDFAEHPRFSSRYLLGSDQEARVRELFRADVLEHLEQADENWCVEGGGAWLLCYRAGKRVAPERLRGFIDSTRTVADLLLRAA